MNYNDLFEAVKDASSFDLYRIGIFISKELDHPERIPEIKRQLRVGATVSYFNQKENRLIDAIILKLNRETLDVQNIDDDRIWNTRYHTINLQNSDTTYAAKPGTIGLDKNELQVGDSVGFYDNDDIETFGVVLKLNRKRAKVLTDGGARWNVYYKNLFRILPGRKIESEKMIEAKVIET